MIRTSRRIYAYWLLLLIPTLVVGAGAMYLLRREQTRLDEAARAAAEGQRAAIEARARLIAENVELVIGDVQSGLMAGLTANASAGADDWITQWPQENPLVQGTFKLGTDDRLLKPATAAPWLRAWLATPLPWRSQAKAALSRKADEQQRRDIDWNVSQTQKLRSDIQVLTTNSGLAQAAEPRSQLAETERARQQTAGAPAPAAAAPAARFPAAKAETLLKDAADANRATIPVVRSGWTPWRMDGELHLIGWMQSAGGVSGVVVNLAAITARLGELLPRDGNLADAFAIQESGGAAVQRKIYASSGSSFASSAGPRELIITIPISPSALPGWAVVGYARLGAETRGAGGGIFLIGSLLVGIFVVAILAGGSLLLWQARRSEAEAAQKTSFVANVSHEFKTPLTTIRLYSELLEQGRVRDAAQGADYLRTIGRETQRLARLVNNALDFSRLEQGRKKFAPEPLDLAAELGRLLDTHAPRVAEAGLALKRALPSEPLRATTDRDAIEQIVLNLIDNACKYAESGGEVLVTLASRAPGGVEVRVADRGPGVPTEHCERIFEKFHRVDEALTAEKSGAGLGLSIARQLARGLGGELRYAPRAGGGAEFILELP